MFDVTVIQNQFGVKAIHRFQSPIGDKEELFEALNGMGTHRNLRHLISYSMTARDYLRIGNQWWFCASFGWELMPEKEMDRVIKDVLTGVWER